jgi:hypothetical protein
VKREEDVLATSHLHIQGAKTQAPGNCYFVAVGGREVADRLNSNSSSRHMRDEVARLAAAPERLDDFDFDLLTQRGLEPGDLDQGQPLQNSVCFLV